MVNKENAKDKNLPLSHKEGDQNQHNAKSPRTSDPKNQKNDQEAENYNTDKKSETENQKNRPSPSKGL